MLTHLVLMPPVRACCRGIKLRCRWVNYADGTQAPRVGFGMIGTSSAARLVFKSSFFCFAVPGFCLFVLPLVGGAPLN